MNMIYHYSQNERSIYDVQWRLTERIATKIRNGNKVSVERLSKSQEVRDISRLAACMCRKNKDKYTKDERKAAEIRIAETIIEDAEFINNNK